MKIIRKTFIDDRRDYWDLSVEDNHNFVLEDGTVAHNCGAGAGVSVQKHHVSKMPGIRQPTKQAKTHIITDDIEGWATAVDVLMSSYFVGGGKYPEFEGRKVHYNKSLIRDKGAMISGGFKAPGPEPLILALNKIEHLLDNLIKQGINNLEPIHVYDISMFIADAVLSGGVRRSATIFLFSPNDDKMMKAKTGNWFAENPQRARSNNSVVIVRKDADKQQFKQIVQYIKDFGEPGFIFTESTEHCFNPCVEIGMAPYLLEEDGVRISGWQGCNLVEINGAKAIDELAFYKMCRVAAIIGTLQAGYTNFKFLPDTTKKIFEREALMGVSITGWMNNPDVLFDKDVLKAGAEIIKETNRMVADIIGINYAARTTCVKPSGNASVLLQTSSGIHGEHSRQYIRYVQMNKETEVAKLIKKINPHMVEESVWSTNRSDYNVAFPVIAPPQSMWRKDLYGINLLEKVKLVQQSWVEFGTDESLCVDPTVRHNVSNTVSVEPNKWEEIADYLFDNRQYFAGISLLSASGDKDFIQAPNTEVQTEEEIVKEYGRGAMFASGLIVDSNKGFANLWEATTIASQDFDDADREIADSRADWIRRFKNYATNYFAGDMKKAEYCLKAVYLLHKWVKIQQNFKPIDFSTTLEEKRYTDIDTMGAQACYGGACLI